MPQTLDFVQEVSERWHVPIVWMEYDLDEENAHTFKVVNHNSASRNGEPFDKLIDKYGRLPNAIKDFAQAISRLELGSNICAHLAGRNGTTRWGFAPMNQPG